jgi:hypothetical protein
MHSFMVEDELSAEAREFYRRGVDILHDAGIPFLVGGAYALERYTGVVRHTKDFDVFLRRRDCIRALAVFGDRGYRPELTFPHWLGKVYFQSAFIDLIFSSGNGVVEVDDGWFAHAVPAHVFDKPVHLCPAEETIWSKSFVMERERYDGADIAHLLRARAERLDWTRLLARFGPDWRLLLTNLILFGYIYPSEQARIPHDVMNDLLERLHQDSRNSAPATPICQGTMLSRQQYLTDINSWGYQDPRLVPLGRMTTEAVTRWSAAIDKNGCCS